MLMAVMIPSSIQAQYWLPLPPYNLLWPLWSSELSPPDPITGIPTPIVSALTQNTYLPVQPGIVWNPNLSYPWLLYHSLLFGMVYYDPLYGINTWPPVNLLDPITGLPQPLALPAGWSMLSPTSPEWLETNIPIADLYYKNWILNNVSIQAAIDADEDGEIIVPPGIYYESNIDFKGKAIILKSSEGPADTIIDCQGKGRGFIFQNGETSASVLEGFTIINGGNVAHGAGIYCQSSSPTIRDCIISHNNAGHKGGGIFCDSGSSPIITRCTLKSNCARISGGGIWCSASSARITNCIISHNKSFSEDEGGGAIFCAESSVTITNSTISANMTLGSGGAIYHDANTNLLTVVNCILWDNIGQAGDDENNPTDEIHLTENSVIDISYSNIQQDFGTYAGKNNINENPLFLKSEQGNYYLKEGSPCIDSGDPNNAPADDRDGFPRPQSEGVDRGAYEYTDPNSATPRAIFITDRTTGASPLIVDFSALHSAGIEDEGAAVEWDFGDGETEADTLTPSHTYSAYGSYDVSLKITTGGEQHTIKINDFITVNSSEITKEVGKGYTYDTIQAAIDDAGNGEIIFVHLLEDFSQERYGEVELNDKLSDANNRYNENINFNGKKITIKGEEKVVKYLPSSMAYVPTYQTKIIRPIIHGTEGAGTSVVTFNHFEDSDSVLDGLWIRGGKSTLGAGISCKQSSPTIKNCTIEDNRSGLTGGGIYCYQSSARIINCSIENNSAELGGGGIACLSCNSLKIINCIIYSNTLFGLTYGWPYKEGGGICCYDSVNTTIADCKITYNSAYSGGEPSIDLYVCGGGIYSKDSNLLITNCTISNNSASQYKYERLYLYGGGIYCKSQDTSFSPSISNCIISHNEASNPPQGYGDGIHCESVSPKITNCIISNNKSYYNKGVGIYCSSSSPIINNCVLVDHEEYQINGDKSNPTIKNCILWSRLYNNVGGSPKVSYSNIYKPGEEVFPGIGNINEDPMFVDPYNGDFRLMFGSPCIDAGIQINDLFSDYRGSLRPVGEIKTRNKFDIGAYEYSWYWGGDADDVVKARLQKIIGVGGIDIVGGKEREIQVWVNADKLQKY
ncbi:MAG: right-handed parallel beta-helix repeat-containing protein, partial [bacterium]